jgi:ABC-type uncharacterized transport system YnjBCD permease subunit
MMEQEEVNSALEIAGLSHGVKAIVSAVGASFLFGAIFWAGVTYNRIQGIVNHLASIDSAVAKIGDIQSLAERTADMQRRMEKLEDAERKRD